MDVGDGATPFQGQEGVEQAGGQVGMLAEDLPEGDVGHRAVIFATCHHSFTVFVCRKDTTEKRCCQEVCEIFFRVDNQIFGKTEKYN